jgi:amino acid adenylation domain-containing protein
MSLIESQADRAPDRVALVAGSRSISYRQLDDRANRLARLLIRHGVTVGTPVAILLERSIPAVVSMLAVLKAGGVCVPLDSDYPGERLDLTVRDVRAPLVLTVAGLRGRLSLPGVTLVELDRVAEEPGNVTVTRPEVSPTDLAYVIYTSGSSGTPKGVEIEHGALRDFATKTARLFGLTSDDAVLQFASIAFVAAVGQIFAPLTAGSRVVLRERQTGAPQLVDYIRRTGVTVLWLTPSVIKYLTRRPDASIATLGAPLRLVRSGGEALTAQLVAQWFRSSSVPILNVYGPTEAVQDVTACLLTEVVPAIPMGRPIFDVAVFVLDDLGRPAAPGQPGELYVSTPGLARGYLNDSQLTRERFPTRTFDGTRRRLYRTGDVVRQRDDGLLEYVGRRDRQVKVLGNRIELGEIEQRLVAHPTVADAAVVVSADSRGDERLVGYYVPDPAAEPDDAEPELLEWCARVLPRHMVPTGFVKVRELPVTVNGKLDRAALRERAGGHGDASRFA